MLFPVRSTPAITRPVQLLTKISNRALPAETVAHVIGSDRGDLSQTTYEYDAQRRWIDSIHSSSGGLNIQGIDYAHYDNGQVHTRSSPSAASREYVYDELTRLSQTKDRSSPQAAALVTSYQYDESGNLTQHGSATNYYLPNKPHLLETVGPNEYFYSATGNVNIRSGPAIPSGYQRIAYTPFNLPSAIVTGKMTGHGAPMTPEVTTRFEYTADQERVLRRDEATSTHLVSKFYQREADYGDTTIEQRFRVFVSGRAIGEVVRSATGDKTVYFHSDHLGSVDTLSDSAGGLEQQQFDPFGTPIDPPTPAVTRAGFTGHDHDPELGFIDMNGRIYDPLAGRFPTPDPITQAPFSTQGLNRYSYVFNDPVNNTDPSGFMSDLGRASLETGAVAITGTSLGLLCYGTNCLSGISSIASGAGVANSAISNSPLPAIGNIVGTLLSGVPLDGSHSVGAVQDVATPSAGPRAGGSSSASPQASAQSKGGVGTMAPFAERSGGETGSGGNSGDIRNLPLKNGRYPVQYVPQRYLRLLQPIFHVLHLNLASIPIIVKPLPQPANGLPVNAQARGWVIVIDPNYLEKASTTDVKLFGTIAHEGTHVVQFVRFGSRAAANARYELDVERYGTYGQYDIPSELNDLSIGQIDPIDSRFALEATANRVKEIGFEAAGF